MTVNPSPKKSRGVTLVELMVTVAVIAVIGAVAIPAYTGYIRESEFAAIRADLDRLRTPIEDYRLDNGAYDASGPPTLAQYISTELSELNAGPHSYSVSPSSNSYDAWGISDTNSSIWVRCEDRFSTCCDKSNSSGANPSDPC